MKLPYTMRWNAYHKSAKLSVRLIGSLLILGIFLAGCRGFSGNIHEQEPIDTGGRVGQAVPTITPSSGVAVVSDGGEYALDDVNYVALIDAAGLDFAEKRIIDVYDIHAQSVVNITTQVLRRSFFFEIVPEEGAGSGFVLDTDGHVLTNYHVIEGAQRIEVSFGDDTILPAEVVGLDARNDVAVLRVDASPDILHPVKLGTSNDLKVGQRAIAIGNPFGQFGRTLTTGVISALDRSLEGPEGRIITGIIQTDAAINRGNSGGPLLDSSGRVIGINTAIFSPSGASAGVGFAVPIDTVRKLLPDLLSLGRYRHPWLGIRYAYALTPAFAQSLNLSVSQGLLLVQLHRNSPLSAANISGAKREVVMGNSLIYVGGDVITAVDGNPVTSLEDLEIFLEDHYQVGDVVTVTVVRGTEQLDVAVSLAEEP